MSWQGQVRASQRARRNPVGNAMFLVCFSFFLIAVASKMIQISNRTNDDGKYVGWFLIVYAIYCLAVAVKQFITKRKVEGIVDFFRSSWKAE